MSRSAYVAFSVRWLDAHPDAPMVERVAHAVVIACGGDPQATCTFPEVAAYLDSTPEDAMQALMTLRERVEADHAV